MGTPVSKVRGDLSEVRGDLSEVPGQEEPKAKEVDEDDNLNDEDDTLGSNESDTSEDPTWDPGVPIMKYVDERARKCPRDCAQSFEKLNQYLMHGLDELEESDALKVRALIVWLSDQDVESFRNVPVSEDTPEGFLSRIAEHGSGYSTFFTVLCREANIICERIEGISRSVKYEAEYDIICSRSNWTAVLMNGKWGLIHPSCACIGVIGHKEGGWIQLEEMGKRQVHRTVAASGTCVTMFNEYFYLPSPYEFRYFFHPDDDEWQLTNTKISREEFLQMPDFFPLFFGLDLKIVSEQKFHLRAVNGEIEISIRAPKEIANTIDLHYTLFLRDTPSVQGDIQEMLTADNLPRLVAMIRCGEIWRFRIQFPVEGIYKLRVNGGSYCQRLGRVVEFRIDCDKRKKECVPLPFDPGRVGFGPGPKAEETGLFVPSHVNGLIPASTNEKINITFQIDISFKRKKFVKAELVNNKAMTSVEERTLLAKQVTLKISKQELKISTHLKQEGEYVLTILSGTFSEERIQSELNELDKEDLETICNYIVSTNVSVHEEPRQRYARSKMRMVMNVEITPGVNMQPLIDEIQKALERCLKENIQDDDPEVMAAKNKICFWQIKKDIRDAFLRERVDVTRQTIEKVHSSGFSQLCRNEVERLERFLQSLTTKQSQCRGDSPIGSKGIPN